MSKGIGGEQDCSPRPELLRSGSVGHIHLIPRQTAAGSFLRPTTAHDNNNSSSSSTTSNSSGNPPKNHPHQYQHQHHHQHSHPNRRDEIVVSQHTDYVERLPPPQLDVVDDLFFASAKSHAHRFRRPINLITNIFTCWCRARPDAGASPLQHFSSQSPHSFAAAALLEQNRLQQEALQESQDTRDMWEWQMEQQRFITCQEHDLLERSSMEGNPLLGNLLPDLVRNAGQLLRNASTHSQHDGSKENQALIDLSKLKINNNNPSTSTEGGTPLPWDLAAPTPEGCDGPDFISAISLLYEATLLRCRSEINFFCRVYMQQMVLSGYSLIKTLKEMEPNTVFLKKVHASYALEARINNALFRCFENDSFDESGLTQIFDPKVRAAARLQDYMRMKAVDPEDALGMYSPAYEPAFHTFCVNKSEEVMAMFSWSMGYRSANERDRFMEAFLRAAKWAWLLHRLANATNPPMQIIRVGRGQDLDPMYLEPVAMPPLGSCQCCASVPTGKVEFMVMPGFISHGKIFRCKVYQHYRCP